MAFLLLQLLRPRRLCVVQSLRQLVSSLFGDQPIFSSSLLAWHQLGKSTRDEQANTGNRLVPKLLTLLSGKGNDIMIQLGATLHDHQRFRTTIPSNLWSWRTICGWPWPAAEKDHINRFELRAVYTALRWRVLRRKELKTRFVHLTDSMFCLHVLSRGRSSSRKNPIFDVSHLLAATRYRPPPVSRVCVEPDESSRQAESATPREAEMGKIVIAAKTKRERKVERQHLGSLRSNTVAPRTKQRYEAALKSFYLYAQIQGLRIPDDAEGVDQIFAEFIEHLWEEGESLSVATDGLSGLQDLRPKFRGHLSLSWRLIKTWQKKEVPNRAPPLPEDLLHCLCGFFLLSREPVVALALEVAFYCLLRTGELLQLQAKQIEVSPNLDFAVISLGPTKTSQRSGTHDSVTLRVSPVCKKLWHWKAAAKPSSYLVSTSEYCFRRSFDAALHALPCTGGNTPTWTLFVSLVAGVLNVQPNCTSKTA